MRKIKKKWTFFKSRGSNTTPKPNLVVFKHTKLTNESLTLRPLIAHLLSGWTADWIKQLILGEEHSFAVSCMIAPPRDGLHHTLVAPWSMVHGPWSMVHDPWSIVSAVKLSDWRRKQKQKLGQLNLGNRSSK